MSLQLDEIDLKIISILKENSRVSFTEVGRKLGVSDATIHVRVKKLEEQGIIKKYTILVDPEVLGKKFRALILLNISPGVVDEVLNEISKIEDVYELYEIHGRYDALVKVMANSLEDIRDIIVEKLRSIKGVTSTEVLTVFKTWKEETG